MNKELIGIQKTEDYRLYSSPFVVGYQSEIIRDCNIGYKHFNEIFNKDNKGTTLEYLRYNIFSLTIRSNYFYVLYQQIIASVREFVGDDRPLWMQAWMNYHLPDEVLGWHGHSEKFLLHGYISIDPKKTITRFNDYVIENKVGNFYLGKTGDNHMHCVEVLEPYEGHRITLAFDVLDSYSTNPGPANLSFIPIP